MSWQAGIDARLVARLLRARQPGLIGMRVARRIVGAVEQMAGRLPLLARFPRLTERSRAGETAIVHALPLAAPAAEPMLAAGAAKPERSAAPERAIQVVAARVIERERRIERTIVELFAPPPPSSSSSSPPPPRGSNERAAIEPGSRAEAMRPAPEPPSRRSRMGAPLAKAPLPQVAPVVARTTRTTHTVANQPAPTHAPGQIPRAPSIRAAGSSHASASPIVTPRRATPIEPAGPPAPGRALVLLRASEVAAPREPIVSPHRAPVQRAGAALAHIAPAPVAAASAAARSDAAPPAIARRALASPVAPLPLTRAAASPITQPLQRADLPEIAAQVQRIMEREAHHDRARRGLRR